MNSPDFEATLFDGVLDCHFDSPLSLAVIDPRRAGVVSRVAADILLAVALVEDNPPDDGRDEAHHHLATDRATMRLEAKLDLALGMLARLLARGQARTPREASVRMSHRGACIDFPPGEGSPEEISAGETLLLCLPAALWLPQEVELPMCLLASGTRDDGGTRLWCRFDPADEALGEAIAKHLFRLHRRAVAQERRHR